MVVASKMGLSLDQLKQSVDRDEIYDWMALAISQGWWVPPKEEEPTADPLEVIEKWLTANSA